MKTLSIPISRIMQLDVEKIYQLGLNPWSCDQEEFHEVPLELCIRWNLINEEMYERLLG